MGKYFFSNFLKNFVLDSVVLFYVHACLHVCICTRYMPGALEGSKKSIGSSGTGITGGSGPL